MTDTKPKAANGQPLLRVRDLNLVLRALRNAADGEGRSRKRAVALVSKLEWVTSEAQAQRMLGALRDLGLYKRSQPGYIVSLEGRVTELALKELKAQREAVPNTTSEPAEVLPESGDAASQWNELVTSDEFRIGAGNTPTEALSHLVAALITIHENGGMPKQYRGDRLTFASGFGKLMLADPDRDWWVTVVLLHTLESYRIIEWVEGAGYRPSAHYSTVDYGALLGTSQSLEQLYDLSIAVQRVRDERDACHQLAAAREQLEGLAETNKLLAERLAKLERRAHAAPHLLRAVAALMPHGGMSEDVH